MELPGPSDLGTPLRLFSGPQHVFDQILEHLPEIESLAEELSTAISYFGSAAYSTRPSGAIPLVTAQAINDFVDGLWDCLAGRGRPALRATRAVFESLINLKDLLANPELEQRYMEHLDIVEAVTSEVRTTPGFLTPRERIKEFFGRRRRQKALELRATELREQYGRKFVTQWHPSDLRTRSRAHGHEAEYQFYRKASAVLHGGSAGRTGLVADTRGLVHYRTGPALELCQVAYPYLVKFFSNFVEEYRAVVKDQGIDELLGALDKFRRLSNRYVSLVKQLDKTAWPTGPVPGPTAVAVLRGDSGPRWYLHDIANGRIREARLVQELPSEVAALLDAMDAVAAVSGSQEPVSVAFFGMEVEPVEDAPWIGEQQVLAPTLIT